MSQADHTMQSWADWVAECSFFLEALNAAEIQWFFVQGLEAIRTELYLPGVSALLNGIEASLRVTLQQVASEKRERFELSPYRVLSNVLLNSAHKVGMPVDALAFPGEGDFFARLASQKPNRIDVELVRLRNNICHGNILEFIQVVEGTRDTFFTPECLRETAKTLLVVAFEWVYALGNYRRAKGLPHWCASTPPIPPTPQARAP
jgi:hypothetical protein